MFNSPSGMMCKRESHQYDDPAAWHNKFYSEVTSSVDEEIFKPLFTSGNKDNCDGRLNVPVRILFAMRVLKEGCGCSDENLFEQCRYNLLFRAALGLLNLHDITPIHAQTIRQTEVSFPILNGKMRLQGVISQVSDTPQQSPILVFVTPPQASNRDYAGFFKALSDSLNRKGYTTFRYDNRSYSDTLTGKQHHEGRYTMHDAANDLHDALTFLKTDKRFASHPVGVIGHSEGGSAAIIEASRNTEIKQLLLLATMGVKGEQVYYEQNMSRLTPFLQRLSPSAINIVRNLTHLTARVLASEPKDEQALEKLQKEMAKIYQQHPSLIHSSFGNLTEQEFIDFLTSPLKNDTRMFAVMRYDPARYLRSIRCPIFNAYAENDNLLNYIEHQAGIERTLLEYQHFNFFSIAIDDANHSFEDQEFYLPLYVSVHRKEPKLNLEQAFSTLLDNMANWLQATMN